MQPSHISEHGERPPRSSVCVRSGKRWTQSAEEWRRLQLGFSEERQRWRWCWCGPQWSWVWHPCWTVAELLHSPSVTLRLLRWYSTCRVLLIDTSLTWTELLCGFFLSTWPSLSIRLFKQVHARPALSCYCAEPFQARSATCHFQTRCFITC